MKLLFFKSLWVYTYFETC